jgi:NADPH-dependent curcumin reductase CurA
MPGTLRRWVYARPIEDDTLRLEQFALVEAAVPELSDGEALVRVKLVNIHSSTRARMARGLTALGETDFSNYACAQVIASRDPAFREGDVIACQAGWQDYQVIRGQDGPVHYAPPQELVKALNGTNSQWCYVFRPAMVKMWPAEVLMEMFGTSGMTAYFGLRECGPIVPRDRVAVAGATGSVGSIAAQLAKIAGAYVVGFAGGAERCRWVVETLGLDACLDYAERLDAGPGARPTLRRAFGLTDGIEARLKERNIKSEAWIVDAFYHERLKAEDDLSRQLISGALKPINTVAEGFESLPQAIVDLYQKGRSGKLQVRFHPD